MPTTSATPPTTDVYLPPNYVLVQRNDRGPLPVVGIPISTMAEAKWGAILRNRTRPDPLVWWVVADAAGRPLDPQP